MSDTSFKTYRVDFYQGSTHPKESESDEEGPGVGQLLENLLTPGTSPNSGPAINLGSFDYELRELRRWLRGNAIRGVLGKFRHDDLPHAGAPGRPERPLRLDDDEGLIEKNHFLYFKDRDLLVFQVNGHGSRPARLAEYLQHINEVLVTFAPVLQVEPTRRLMRGDVSMRSLELSFARPNNPDAFPQDAWSRQVLSILNASGAVRMNIRVSADARSSDRTSHRLVNGIKAAAAQFADYEGTRTAKAKLEDEHGDVAPIDLIADRISGSVEVRMNGRYPEPTQMYEGLRTAEREIRDELDAVLSESGGS